MSTSLVSHPMDGEPDLPEKGSTGRGAPALEVEGLTKRYPGVTALEDVGFVLRGGEVHGVVGENGAGKSTLMSIIAGAQQADEGIVKIAGEPFSTASTAEARRRGVSIVRQEPALLPDLSIAENIYLGVDEAHRPAARKVDAWATAILDSWSSDTGLKGGMRVDALDPEHRFIVEIAKALANEPSVLILDEPTEHLVEDDIERLFNRIRALAAAGTAIVYISHRVREVKRVSDRITVLRDGRTQGTYDAETLDEHQIVNLIVGRQLERSFPEKRIAGDGDEPPRVVLRGLTGPGFEDVSLSIAPGEVVGLAGIDGSGQRELLRAIAGLTRFRGDLRIDGERRAFRTTSQATRAGVAFLSGDRHREGMLAGMSVRENLVLRSLRRLSRMGLLARSHEQGFAGEAIRKYRVKTPGAETAIDNLSGGNQQKVGMAAVLETEPRLLLLDEPTQGVDVGARAEIYDVIRRQASEHGTAIIVVSSDSNELAGLCDRVAVFARGRTVAELEGDDLSESAIIDAVLTNNESRTKTTARTSRFVSWLAGDAAPLWMVGVVVVGLTVLAQSANEFFLSPLSLKSLLFFVAILALTGMAQALTMMVGGIDVSIGPLMGFLVIIGSFFFTDGTTLAGQGFGWILFFGLAIVVGVANWALIVLAKLSPLVATIITYIALQSISLMLRPAPGGVISSGLTSVVKGSFGFVPYAFVAVVILTAIFGWMLARSKQGFIVRGVGSKDSTASLLGMKPNRVRLFAYIGSALIGSLAAILFMGQIGIGDAASGVSYTTTSITVAVVGGASVWGGRGSFVGVLLAAIMMQQIDMLTTFMNLGPEWYYFLSFGLTVAAVSIYSKSRQAVSREV
ncbi:MAG: ATP-binding cassette domain-containing protein [Leucobacter sp.]